MTLSEQQEEQIPSLSDSTGSTFAPVTENDRPPQHQLSRTGSTQKAHWSSSDRNARARGGIGRKHTLRTVQADHQPRPARRLAHTGWFTGPSSGAHANNRPLIRLTTLFGRTSFYDLSGNTPPSGAHCSGSRASSVFAWAYSSVIGNSSHATSASSRTTAAPSASPASIRHRPSHNAARASISLAPFSR